MKIRLLQNYDNRDLVAGRIIDNELSASIKRELIKEGKAETVEKSKKVEKKELPKDKDNDTNTPKILASL